MTTPDIPTEALEAARASVDNARFACGRRRSRKEPTMASGSVPFTYVVPVRRRWWGRIEIVEYAGTVLPAPVPGQKTALSFQATGPLTRTVHARRFWLMWSAKRYLDRLKAERRG